LGGDTTSREADDNGPDGVVGRHDGKYQPPRQKLSRAVAVTAVNREKK
jgi:hypothetical protein